MKKQTITYSLFLIAGLLFGVFILQTSAVISGFGTVTGTTNVSNAAPSILEIVCDDGIDTEFVVDLVAGGTRTVYCDVLIEDLNLPEDTLNVEGYIWHTDKGIDGSTSEDNNEEYWNTTCTTYAGTNSTTNYAECSFDMYYYANPGDWFVGIYVQDEDAEWDWLVSETNLTVNELIAIDVGETISFGALSVGETSEDIPFPVENYGNVQTSVVINGTNFACDSGVINRSYVQFFNAEFDYNVGYTLPEFFDEASLNGFLYQKVEDDIQGDELKDSHWRIRIPSGVRGVCTGTIQFTGVKYVSGGGGGGAQQ